MRRRRGQPIDEKDKDKPEEAVVPLDPVNEQVVIAAACVSQEVADELLPVIQADMFHGRGHAKAWDTLREMRRRGLYYDPATLAQMSGGEVDPAYVEGLVKDRPQRPPNLRHHVDALYWDKARVDAARGPLAGLLRALHDVTTAPETVRALARQVAEAFDGHGSDRYLVRARDVARDHAKVLVGRMSGQACFSYGIETLDRYADGPRAGEWRMIPGAEPGGITVLTGVSGTAKSTVAARMMLGLARQRRRVLCGAWEMREAPTLELLAAMSLGISRRDLKTGSYNEGDARELAEAMEQLDEYVKFFRLPFGKVRSERGQGGNDRQLDLIRQVVADSRCEVFFADLMRRAMKETKPDDEDQFLYRLQSDGAELGVHQVWIHQIRLKDVEQRRDKRPTREGLKGSSGWVEVPDCVLGCHREALWKDVEDNRLEIIVLKQRHGDYPIAVEFEWDAEYGSLENGRCKDYVRPGESDDLDAFMGGRGRGRH